MDNRLVRFWKRLSKSQQGSVLAFSAVGMVALVGATGVAVDVGRGQLVESKLSSSLDAAGLAAGSSVNTTNITSEANKFLNANFQDYMGSHITSVSVTANADNSIITLSATATLPTTFMRIFGEETMNVAASAEVTRAISGLELALVLDNTGSMSGTKLTNLKTAALSLIDILYGSNSTVENLWIGLVPFAQTVNIGATRTAWMDTAYTASLNWGPTSWGGCVDARTGSADTNDDPPASQLFKAYYWPDNGSYNDWIKPSGTSYYSPLNVTSLGPNKYCSQLVTPLTASKTTIVNGINAMQARGNTHINQGAAWGWRMLSPRWRGLWGGEMDANSLPLDYNTPKMNKAAIIMTDGDNTMSNSVHTAYWYLSNGKLGTTNQTTAEAQLDTRLSQICTSMKTNNIIIYTIAFGTLSSSSQTMLRNCASQPDYFFNSPTSTELQAAFNTIGDSLSNLRISK